MPVLNHGLIREPSQCGVIARASQGQEERLQLWVLLFGYMVYDRDRDDLRGISYKGATQFAKVYVTPPCTQEDVLGLHCNRDSSPNCSESN